MPRITTRLLLLPLLLALAACGSELDSSTDVDGDAPEEARVGLVIGSAAPELVGINGWINSEPLTLAGQFEANRVVLIDVWTYTCSNCIHTLPYVRGWHEKYADRGLTIIGVHTPEFSFEADRDNVIEAAQRLGVTYPIAQDNDWQTWRALNNRYWPALYLVGVDGAVRYQHFGEGRYDEIERQIRDALTEAGRDISDIPLGGIAAQQAS
ncbi:MAG: redoxin family protein [Dehalococcoidia bacterium]|jgi:thiol-disulfide isomerase/thioredoxin|nr:redoxin family protein [Dehalococcoidia bacterium]